MASHHRSSTAPCATACLPGPSVDCTFPIRFRHFWVFGTESREPRSAAGSPVWSRWPGHRGGLSTWAWLARPTVLCSVAPTSQACSVVGSAGASCFLSLSSWKPGEGTTVAPVATPSVPPLGPARLCLRAAPAPVTVPPPHQVHH